MGAYTTIDDPSVYFQTKTYTGTSGIHDVTLDGNSDMQPDFVWFKNRTVNYSHSLYDSSRGVNKPLSSDLTNDEGSITNGLTRFVSDGFRVSSAAAINENSIVCWNWKANGGTTSSNTDGDITSTVQANTTAGFSIMTYSGTTGDVHTIGHGLGVTPEVWIVKQRSGNSEFKDWFFWHHHMAASNIIDNRMMFLNTTAGIATYTGINAVTSTTIRVKSSTTAQNGDTYVAYAFVGKQGYSQFGSYTGTGDADGRMIATGFKPAFILLKKSSDSGDNWMMYDNERPGFNVTDQALRPNSDAAEYDNANANIDILSNGFKLRTSFGWVNQSSHTYIYMAFAENPFVTSDASGSIPTTAR